VRRAGRQVRSSSDVVRRIGFSLLNCRTDTSRYHHRVPRLARSVETKCNDQRGCNNDHTALKHRSGLQLLIFATRLRSRKDLMFTPIGRAVPPDATASALNRRVIRPHSLGGATPAMLGSVQSVKMRAPCARAFASASARSWRNVGIRLWYFARAAS
jgi:hypothetical protein